MERKQAVQIALERDGGCICRFFFGGGWFGRGEPRMNEPKVYEDRMYKTAKKLGLPGVAVVSKKDQTTVEERENR